MKLAICLVSLLSFASAAPALEAENPPQSGLVKLLAQHPENPCGQGVEPSCSEESCECPNGDVFDPEKVIERLGEQLLNSRGNPCGAGEPVGCTCNDGSDASLWTRNGLNRVLSQEVCEGSNPADRLPASCSCPSGKSLDPAEFFKRVTNAIHFLSRGPQTGLVKLLAQHPENPCGQGVEPSCSKGSCECPNGDVFDPEKVIERLGEQLLNSRGNPCGAGEPVGCTCNDGSDASLWTRNGLNRVLSQEVCEGSNPADGLPASCSCPSGKTLDPAEFFKLVTNTIHSLSRGQDPSLISRLSLHVENPCGVAVTPKCSDGQCLCPNGEVFDTAAIMSEIRKKLLNSKGNPCGSGNAPQCVCGNGEEAAVWTGKNPADGVCDGNTKEERLPTNCSCPDGTSLDPKKLLETLLKRIQGLRVAVQQ